MDLLRRQAAGELAELFGGGRAGSGQRTASTASATWPAGWSRRARGTGRSCEAYAAGVNAGLAALGRQAFRVPRCCAPSPRPWKPEDTVLVVLRHVPRAARRARRPARVEPGRPARPPAARPCPSSWPPSGTEWDAPLVGEPLATPPMPGPEVFDLRREPPASPRPARSRLAQSSRRSAAARRAGSNNWAVAGTHTADGRALARQRHAPRHLACRIPGTGLLVWPDGRRRHRSPA